MLPEDLHVRTSGRYRARSGRLAGLLTGSLAALLLFPTVPARAQQAAAGAVDPALLAGMEARRIGPAGMSSRIASIEAVASNPDIIYVGVATSGICKSKNRGLTWEPLFDEQPVHSIGAVAVFQPPRFSPRARRAARTRS